jgi:hypothetical protein
MDDVFYAVMAHRASHGESGAIGYDVMAIQGHDAQGADVFLWLTPVGWSRTLEGVHAMIARKELAHTKEEKDDG